MEQKETVVIEKKVLEQLIEIARSNQAKLKKQDYCNFSTKSLQPIEKTDKLRLIRFFLFFDASAKLPRFFDEPRQSSLPLRAI